MSGTKAGGLKAYQTNIKRNPNHYAEIGSKGGKNGNTGGFAANPELARIAGRKGGRISRRRKSVNDVASTIPAASEQFTTVELEEIQAPTVKRSLMRKIRDLI